MPRILITGSRSWTDRITIHGALDTWGGDGTTVVTGACPKGADRLAEEEARALGYEVERHPADWSRGKSGGFRRNEQMVRLGADVCLAFWDGQSRGTRHTIDLARSKGIETIVYRPKEGT